MVSTIRAVPRILIAMAIVASLSITALALNATRSYPIQPPIVSLQHGHRQLRILLVGDSMAGTLGLGLAAAAPSSGVTLINAALVGCGVSIAWDDGWASSVWVPGPPNFPCQSPKQLTTYWKSFLRRYRPAVVIYVNRMDTISQEVNPGSTQRMTSVLNRQFQAYLTSAMTKAVGVLSSYGAHVILTTSAPTKIGLVGNQYDNPRRWLIYDKILRSVASRSNGRVSIFDLGRFFGGNGSDPKFSLIAPSGVQWRCADGIHFSVAGGILVAPSLLKLAWKVAPPADLSASMARAVPPSVANRPWPPYAAQQSTMGCPA
jgi:hypothetical protein